MRTTSLPHAGGLIIILSAALAAYALFREWKNKNQSAVKLNKIAAVGLLSLLVSCSPKPEPIEYGLAECANCKMLISDQRFGSEIVTTKNKVHAFDSIECMAAFILEEKIKASEIHSVWVTDMLKPGNLIDAQNALFLKSDHFRSPMGLNFSAFTDSTDLSSQINIEEEIILHWSDVSAIVRKAWMEK